MDRPVRSRAIDLAVQRIRYRYTIAVFALEPMYRKHLESPFTGEQWAVAVEENVVPVAHDVILQLDELDNLPQNELDELRTRTQNDLGVWQLRVFQLREGNVDEFIDFLRRQFERK